MKRNSQQSNIPTLFFSIFRLSYLIVLLFLGSFIYRILLSDIFDDGQILLPTLLLWIFSAYIFLPRIHRWFSKLYIPDYFIGRVKTYDGLLGDPVNIAVRGSKTELILAMRKAGWTQADDLSFQSSLKMVRTSLLGKSYPKAPVSSLYLFNNKQNLAFQKEVDNNPRKRHHVRFWATPKNWWLPGGHTADWLGAATYDRRVGFSGFTLQITHKIAENTDEERDYLLSTIKKISPKPRISVVQHFTSGYHDKNGGGDRIKTDGSLPFIDL